MIVGIHHVQITVPVGSEEQAKSFYCGVLGLCEVPKPDALKRRGGFWLQAGDRSVHVGVEDDVERSSTKAHVAYEVTDLAHWRRVLVDRGIEAFDGIPLPGFSRLEFRDPFGNRVELIQQLGQAGPRAHA